MSRSGYLSGLAAEEIALRLYTSEGARLLAKRWRSEAGEVDLVIAEGDTIVFVEVKARRRAADAAGAVTPAQWRRLGLAAQIWLGGAPPGTPCRFDLVVVDREGRAERLANVGWFNET